ncbi:MAG: hypothetical protein GWO10_16725, partial [candidate division Zixibacteria bacterium]|nr:hypothetical protein [Phycisphaerae bacterium]NIR65368.1 hypothetical protein [candidate division Zixibacteria bacterium]NIW97526.1 hypothetical protein [Phycisphaerae bacterium]
DYPVILLRNAVTRNNTNVQLWHGEIRKTKLRSKELVKVEHGISSLDTSANTISLTGDVTAHYPNASNITIYNQSDDSYEEHTLNTTGTFNGTST